MHRNHYLLAITTAIVFLASPLLAQQDTLLTWCQTTWHRDDGQWLWSDDARFWRHERIAYQATGEISVVAWEQIQVADLTAIYSLTETDTMILCGTSRSVLFGPTVFSSPEGEDWQPSIDYPIIHPVTFDSLSLLATNCMLTASDGAVYAAGMRAPLSEGLVLKSTDGAATWSPTDSLAGSSGHEVKTLVEAPDGTLYLGTHGSPNGFVYRSSDGGDSWEFLTALDGVQYVEAILPLGDTVYAATRTQNQRGKVFRSTDGGATWDSTSTIPDAIWAYDLAAIGDTIYVSVAYNPSPPEFYGAVFYSPDGGASWARYQHFDGTYIAPCLLADGDSALYVGTGSTAKVFIAFPPDSFISLGALGTTRANDLFVTSDGVLIVAATGGSIYRAIGAALPGWLESSVYDTRSGTTFGTATWDSEGDDVIIKVRSGANSEMIGSPPWVTCDTLVNGQDITDLASVQDGHRYLQYYVEIVKQGVAFPVLREICIDYTAPYDTVSPVFSSTTIWEDSTAWFGGPYEVSAVLTDDFAGVDDDNVYLHWTRDGWQTERIVQMDEDEPGTFSCEIRRQVEGDTVEYYLKGQDLSFQFNQAFSPSDYPASTYRFEIIPEGPRFFNTTVMDSVVSDRGPYFIGTLVKDASLDPYSVLLRYQIDGGGWIDTMMSVYPNDLFIGVIPEAPGSSTIDYYLWAIDTLGQEGTDPVNAPTSYYTFSYVGIAEERIRERPLAYGISQNSPNPFSSSSSITYEVPVETEVSVKVYDGLGRVVKVLAEGWRAPGRYPLFWDRCDSRGERVPAGTYFCRIETEAFSATRKMVVIE